MGEVRKRGVQNARNDRAAARRKQVAANRLGGMTVREIAESLGVAPGTVHVDLKLLRKEWREDRIRDAGAIVEDENRRLDVMLNASWNKATSGDSRAIDSVLRIMKRRSELLGLDAPEKIALSGDLGLSVGMPPETLEALKVIWREDDAEQGIPHGTPEDL